ncbi:TAR DNA-binding protein 43-like [Scaptodrosophila lebanonensis]|uniref:TAR DNA-binding protein 43-like n=1 Tax=Drosophila lebanonensis TaxID=7225 RepID=A0A6J2TBC0_DROLE|nr:TAR DNA-binding protein 43-like [Scaptodrosophila lebanonensis]XP_030372662.1 TAR DNA-binding protein 43-like [Scaptodrosophila lebanonensis]
MDPVEVDKKDNVGMKFAEDENGKSMDVDIVNLAAESSDESVEIGHIDRRKIITIANEDFVQVAEQEGDNPIELPAEEDGTLLLSTLQAQFSGSCGLQYRNMDTKAVRGIRSNQDRLFPPNGASSWGENVYFCVFPKEIKRKRDDDLVSTAVKAKRIESGRCIDLIVLGLSWETTENRLRKYFQKYGEVTMANIKTDYRSGHSRGFGFIRFASYETQKLVLSTSRHLIDGRWCEIKVPNAKGNNTSNKVFVGRCTENISSNDLREYFSKFGEVSDIYIPQPFRAFSFVTFFDADVAQSLCGEDHIIKGVSVNVSNAIPKHDQYNQYRGSRSPVEQSFNY